MGFEWREACSDDQLHGMSVSFQKTSGGCGALQAENLLRIPDGGQVDGFTNRRNGVSRAVRRMEWKRANFVVERRKVSVPKIKLKSKQHHESSKDECVHSGSPDLGTRGMGSGLGPTFPP